MKIKWQVVVTIIFVVLLIGIQLAYWFNPISVSDIIDFRDELIRLINEYPVTFASLYISLYALSIIFGIPVSATIIGGYLFGILLGIVYSMLGIAIGSTILCSLVRYVIGDWVQSRYKDELEPLNEELEKYGMHYIVLVHMIPFMPSFLPHIATGISKIPLYWIIILNVMGALPLTCYYSAAGAYIHHINSFESFIFYVGIFSILLGILFILARFYRWFLD